MTTDKRLARHARLVDGMADTLGLDLEEQVLRGNVTPDEIVDAVLSCTGCSKPSDCDAWQLRENGDAKVPPPYCRNLELFAELKG